VFGGYVVWARAVGFTQSWFDSNSRALRGTFLETLNYIYPFVDSIFVCTTAHPTDHIGVYDALTAMCSVLNRLPLVFFIFVFCFTTLGQFFGRCFTAFPARGLRFNFIVFLVLAVSDNAQIRQNKTPKLRLSEYFFWSADESDNVALRSMVTELHT